MTNPETCEHDPDDGGDTCCTCGKIMTEEDRHAFEMRLRARAEKIADGMEARVAKDLDALFPPPSPGRDG